MFSCFGSVNGAVDFTINGYTATQVDYGDIYLLNQQQHGLTGSAYRTYWNTIFRFYGRLDTKVNDYLLFTEVDGSQSWLCQNASTHLFIHKSPCLLGKLSATSTNGNCCPWMQWYHNRLNATLWDKDPYVFPAAKWLAATSPLMLSTWREPNTFRIFNRNAEDI